MMSIRRMSMISFNFSGSNQLFRCLRKLHIQVNRRKFHFESKSSDNFNILKLVEDLELCSMKRKLNVDTKRIKFIINQLKQLDKSSNKAEVDSLNKELENLLKLLPNKTHIDVCNLDENRLRSSVNEKPVFNFKPLQLQKLSEKLDCLVTNHISVLMGPQSYYLKNCLVDLEKALLTSTVDNLLEKHQFELISVPDLLHREIIEACGMDTRGERNQVYKVKKENGEADICLSGTSEMALGGMFTNEIIDISELPLRLAAVSRCFRAETSGLKKEKGIYRVHEFSKVEMFAITSAESGNESSEMLEEFCSIQAKMSEELGLHFNIMDMAPYELGASAYRKYDIEAWMPGRQIYGEISSTSNCTDYQSRRLNIRYRDTNGNLKYVHTVNGTACAIPRMLISIMESFQQADGTVLVPASLRKYLNYDYFRPPEKKWNQMNIKS